MTADVILPSAANAFTSPRVTPSSFEIMFNNIGAFSEIDRNSSPCSRPLPSACVN